MLKSMRKHGITLALFAAGQITALQQVVIITLRWQDLIEQGLLLQRGLLLDGPLIDYYTRPRVYGHR
jgi:Na+-translocating ferredoxin:NAD+ oxidoreductase RnfG subunit